MSNGLDDKTVNGGRGNGSLPIMFLIVCVDILGFALIIPLLPFYARKHDASDFQVTLLFSVYAACQFIASPLLGSLSDRRGRRPVLILSQLGSVAGFLLLGWATQHTWASAQVGLLVIYLSRVIDGLSGGNVSTAYAYISDVTSHENRAKGIGLLGAAFGIGFALGPWLGGELGARRPEYAAYAAAVMSFTAMLLTAWLLPESREHRPGTSEAWLHPQQFLPILRRPAVTMLLAVWFVAMSVFFMMDTTIAMFLADNLAYRYGPRPVGHYFAYVGILIIIVQGGLIGRLTRKVGEWPLSIVGPIGVAIGAGLLVLSDRWPIIEQRHSAAVMLLLVAGFFNAVGRSLHQPTVSALVSKFSDARKQGITFGLFQGVGSLARVMGPLIGGVLYKWHIAAPFAAAAVILAATGLWTATLKARYGQPPAVAPEPQIEPEA